MHRETFIAKLTDVQQTVEQLLAELQASEHDQFAAHLYRSRREYRSACERTLLLPRIVLWIHVVDTPRAYTMNLDDGFFASPDEVIDLGLVDCGATGG
jgi:hypothetical protein